MPPPLPAARPGELRECYYNRAEWGSRSLLAANTSQQECCCTLGEGWGLGSQYQACPPADTGEGDVIRLLEPKGVCIKEKQIVDPGAAGCGASLHT